MTISEGLQDKLGISGKHASGYHAVAHIAYCCSHLPKKQKIPAFATLSKFLDQDGGPPNNLQRDIVDVMKKFTEIASTEKLRFGFSDIPQKVAPVEFVYIGQSSRYRCVPMVLGICSLCSAAIMLFMLIQVCDDITEMAQHIHDMRVFIRKEETDIRSNNKICAKLWIFIDSVMEGYDDDFSPPAKAKAKATKTKTKNKTRDDDYLPAKPQKRARISEK